MLFQQENDITILNKHSLGQCDCRGILLLKAVAQAGKRLELCSWSCFYIKNRDSIQPEIEQITVGAAYTVLAPLTSAYVEEERRTCWKYRERRRLTNTPPVPVRLQIMLEKGLV